MTRPANVLAGGAAFVRMTFMGGPNGSGPYYPDLVVCDVKPNFGCIPS